MDGFKSSQKMQCFKEGGAVKYKSRHSEKSEMSEDIAQDKKVVKKAFAMHDKQSHEGEKTDLKKLNKGGRTKKSRGTVKKFGKENSIKMKKDAADIDEIKAVKQTAPLTAMAPSAPVEQPAAPLPMMKKGKSVKKYNTGGSVMDTVKSVGKKLYENVMGTPEQNKAAAEQEKAIAEKDPSSYEAKYRKLTGKRRGGKVC
jgi:hypothetical protein